MPEFVEVQLLNGESRPAIVVKRDESGAAECVVFLSQTDEPISGLDGIASYFPRVMVHNAPPPKPVPAPKKG